MRHRVVTSAAVRVSRSAETNGLLHDLAAWSEAAELVGEGRRHRQELVLHARARDAAAISIDGADAAGVGDGRGAANVPLARLRLVAEEMVEHRERGGRDRD